MFQRIPFLQTCLRHLLYMCLLIIAVLADIALHFSNWCLPVPITVCLYACMFARAPLCWLIITCCAIAVLPTVLLVPWLWFMVPVALMTVIGFYARQLIYHTWIVPYLLIAVYALMRVALCLVGQSSGSLAAPLTKGSFFIILIAINLFSLILLTSSRRGNRV